MNKGREKKTRKEAHKKRSEDEGCTQALYLGHWTAAPAEVSATLKTGRP
jgi:hypothetical protein